MDSKLVDLEAPSRGGGIFSSYRAPSLAFDELWEDSNRHFREGWVEVAPFFEELGMRGIEEGSQLVRRLVRDSSISYQLPGSTTESHHRPWNLDALPWVLGAREWNDLCIALRQRARLLNRILVDLYGPQELLHEGLIPAKVVYDNPAFSRSFHGIAVPGSLYLHCYTADLVRTSDGSWKVMADRTDAPLGVGYTLENRLVLSRTFPTIFRDSMVQRLAPFFIQLRNLLKQLSPSNNDNPRVALLTQGPGTAGYFEDVYLARYLGYHLVESGDLTVRDDRLYLKTLGGLLQVDALFRRFTDQWCDPLEMQSDASMGIAGLVRAARAGNVLIANALGSSLVESAAILPYLDALAPRLLGQNLWLPSVPTWWCGRPEDCEYVLSHASQLFVGSAFRVGRNKVVPNLTRAHLPLKDQLEFVKQRPSLYVGQSKVVRSVVPSYHQGRVLPSHAALRVYLVAEGDDYRVLPGGLARIASVNDELELDVLTGQNSKEVWVLSDGPVAPISLLTSAKPRQELKRSGSELTSRVADNLLWLGRYVERVDGSARLLRTTLMRLAREANPESLPEWNGLVRQLADRGLVEPGYAVDGLREHLPSLSERLPTLAIDESQPGNLRDSLRQVVRIASLVRDRLSPDSWHVLFFLENRLFSEPMARSREPDDAIGILSQLIVDLSAFLGMTAESMTRTIAWRILDLGRRFERAIGAAAIVRQLSSDLCTSTAEWESLVEVSDSLMTYRFRYLASWSLDAVLDLLLVDETNPRSVAYQLQAIYEHIHQLVLSSQHSTSSPEKQMASKMQQSVRQWGTQDIAEGAKDGSRSAIHLLAEGLVNDLQLLFNLINARYVVHASPARNRGK